LLNTNGPVIEALTIMTPEPGTYGSISGREGQLCGIA